MQLAYKPGNSIFHRIDPLTKFAWVIIIAFWLYSLREIVNVIIVSLTIALLAFFSAKLELRSYLKLTFVVFLASSFLIIYQGLFRPGPGINLGSIVLSYSGMELGLAIGLRTFGLVASGLAFSVTTSPQDFELSMIKIGVPYKISHISYLSLRLLPIFQKDMQTIQDIQDLRNVKKGWNRMKISLIALIMTELRQADNISISLETRGFGLHAKRTELKEVNISTGGIMLIIITILAIIYNYIWI